MITEKDFDARGWHIEPIFARAPLLAPEILAEMGKHHESAGESSWGTRNMLTSFVLSMRPKIFLEIGSHIGSGAVAVGSAMKANGYGTMYCLEPADHYFAILSEFVVKAGVQNHVKPLKMFSTDPQLLMAMGNRPDMVYVDANHSYSHALKDIEIAANILADGGVIFFDDVGTPHSGNIDSEKKGGVRQALLDFSRKRPEFSVIFLDWPFWPNYCGFAMMARRPAQ